MWPYITMLIGIGYLISGYIIRKHDKFYRLTEFFYFIGSVAGYSGAYYFVYRFDGFGSSTFQQWFWVIIYPLLLFVGFYLSQKLQSRIIIVVTSLYLIFYINYLAWQLFEGPFIYFGIIFSGLTIIGVGYGVFCYQKRFLR